MDEDRGRQGQPEKSPFDQAKVIVGAAESHLAEHTAPLCDSGAVQTSIFVPIPVFAAIIVRAVAATLACKSISAFEAFNVTTSA